MCVCVCVCVCGVCVCACVCSPYLFYFCELPHYSSTAQAYVVEITLSDGSKYTVFRRFNEFHDLNQKLEERFPVDAGYFNYGQRTLPEMPGKILFGRSAVRNVAEQRLPQLNEYLKVSQHLGRRTPLPFCPMAIQSPEGLEQDSFMEHPHT